MTGGLTLESNQLLGFGEDKSAGENCKAPADMPNRLNGPISIASKGYHFYCGGSITDKGCYKYDKTTNSFVHAVAMPEARTKMSAVYFKDLDTHLVTGTYICYIFFIPTNAYLVF